MTVENGIYRFEKGWVKVVCLKVGQPVLSISGIVCFDEIRNLVGNIGLDDELAKKTSEVLSEGEKTIQNLMRKGGVVNNEGLILFENLELLNLDRPLAQKVADSRILRGSELGLGKPCFVLAKDLGKYLGYSLTNQGAVAGFSVKRQEESGLVSVGLHNSFVESLGGIFKGLYKKNGIPYSVVPGVSAVRQILVGICDNYREPGGIRVPGGYFTK